jgi:iron complex outermembrane receptor protein
MRRYSLATEGGDDQARVKVQYVHQESDGYRDHAKMVRDAVQVQSDIRVGENNVLRLTALYSDLFYQTPGALTKAQFDENPKQARPAAGPNPGSIDQKASIHNQTFYTGASYEHRWNAAWSTKAGLYSSITKFENPTLLVNNYERRLEVGYGGKLTTRYAFRIGTLDIGGEYQHSYAPIRTYQSVGGKSGNLLKDDELDFNTYSAFAQSEIRLPVDFSLTAGLSVNYLEVGYKSLMVDPLFKTNKTFDAVLSPRIALFKKIIPTLTTYVSWSKGFSPPTIQELYAADGIFNYALLPEMGSNVELGVKGHFFEKALYTEISWYHFGLSESIVGRRDVDGNDYYINAGKTKQRGVELSARLNPLKSSRTNQLQIWSSLTLQDYRFSDYQKVDVSLKGKEIAGIAPLHAAFGIDVRSKVGVYGNITYQHLSKLALDDANTTYANAYDLVGAKVGYVTDVKMLRVDLFVLMDNALNETYSLGHDLNAFGGRFYNAAAKRNVTVGVKLGVGKVEKK